MSRRPRRNHSTAIPEKVARAAENGEATLAELAQRVQLVGSFPLRRAA